MHSLIRFSISGRWSVALALLLGALWAGLAGAQSAETPRQGCLTRTADFWGTHPFLTTGDDPRSLDLLPLAVCGKTLDNVNAGNGSSTTEAICSAGREGNVLSPQLAQILRQCTAAELNVAASLASGGDCESPFDFPHLGELLTACCGAESVCTGSPVQGYDIRSCIFKLYSFNNTAPDTLSFPFDAGPPDSIFCQVAGNHRAAAGSTP